MARNKQNRVIQQPPKTKGFNPMGLFSSKSETIQLNFEEYESIRLIDYENLSQEQASSYMKISRPTLTRIYDSARKKISKALIGANQLLIEGGNYTFEGEWYECSGCQCSFNNPLGKDVTSCVLCGANEVNLLSGDE